MILPTYRLTIFAIFGVATCPTVGTSRYGLDFVIPLRNRREKSVSCGAPRSGPFASADQGPTTVILIQGLRKPATQRIQAL